MKEFGAELGDLDIEILSQGSRGILGVGGEESRILAAPKSAVAAAETIRAEPADDEGPPRRSPPMSRPRSRPMPTRRSSWPMPATTRSPSWPEPMMRVDRAVAAAVAAGVVPVPAIASTPSVSRAPTVRRASPARTDPRASPHRSCRASRPGAHRRGALDARDREDRAHRDGRPDGPQGDRRDHPGGDAARLDVKGDDLGALIGRRGEKLAGLQHIVDLIVGRREGQHQPHRDRRRELPGPPGGAAA